MKKKFLALALALTLALSLAACGGKDAPAQDGTSSTAVPRRQRLPRPRRRAPRRLTSPPSTTPSGRRTPGRS